LVKSNIPNTHHPPITHSDCAVKEKKKQKTKKKGEEEKTSVMGVTSSAYISSIDVICQRARIVDSDPEDDQKIQELGTCNSVRHHKSRPELWLAGYSKKCLFRIDLSGKSREYPVVAEGVYVPGCRRIRNEQDGRETVIRIPTSTNGSLRSCRGLSFASPGSDMLTIFATMGNSIYGYDTSQGIAAPPQSSSLDLAPFTLLAGGISSDSASGSESDAKQQQQLLSRAQFKWPFSGCYDHFGKSDTLYCVSTTLSSIRKIDFPDQTVETLYPPNGQSSDMSFPLCAVHVSPEVLLVTDAMV
jgi:hypothetical protein